VDKHVHELTFVEINISISANHMKCPVTHWNTKHKLTLSEVPGTSTSTAMLPAQSPEIKTFRLHNNAFQRSFTPSAGSDAAA
jgi:hypothetical protein